ncbi:MAG: hypothetical protein GWN87_06870 [Desulfuromonadales bacterium]|nr:hypothetical protein [Desulfuromonadales bacterium]
MHILIAVLSLALAPAVFAQEDAEKKPAEELKTPFGVAKTTDAPPPKPARKPSKLRPDLKVEKDGDAFKFSKKTPFGMNSWTRAEAELSSEERAIVEDRGLLKVAEDVEADEPVAGKPQP